MKSELLIVLGLLIFAGTVFATPSTIAMSSLPSSVDPASTPVNVAFTLQNPTFVVGINSMNAELVLSPDATLGNGDDVLVNGPVNALTLCTPTPTSFSTPQSCAFSWASSGAAPEGALNVFVRATVDGNETSSDSEATVLDLTAPTLNGNNVNLVNSVTFAINDTNWTNHPVNLVVNSGACADNVSCTLQYQLDANTYSNFTSPHLFTSGSGTLSVRGVDPAGHASNVVTRTMMIDNAIPALSQQSPTAPTNDNTPDISFNLVDALSGLASVTVKVDGNPVATPTPSGNTYSFTSASLADGSHTVEVIAADNAGNTLNTSNTWTFIVDTTAPVFSSFTAASPTNDTTPTFSLTATDASPDMNVRMRCSGGANYYTTPYASTIDMFDITNTTYGCPSAEGPRTINAHVVDRFGLASTDLNVTITYTTADTQAPTTPTGLSTSSITSSSVTLSWNASTDNVAVTGYRVDVSEQENFSSFISSTWTNHNVGNVTSVNITELDDATQYHFRVRAYDAVPNTSANSSSISITTLAGSSSNNNNNNNNTNNTSTSTGGGGGGGGGGGTTCAVNLTFTYPDKVYAGDVIAVKVTAPTVQSSGNFRWQITGVTPTTTLKQGGGTEFAGTINVPNQIGKVMVLRFGSDSCSLAQRNITILDPASRLNASAQTPDVTPPAAAAATTAPTPAAAAPTLPEPLSIALSADALGSVLDFAGFNSSDAALINNGKQAITDWQTSKTIDVIPAAVEGKYTVRVTLQFTNAQNKGTIKVIESVPKEFAQTAAEIESSYAMTVLQDDPLVQFEISNLVAGQSVEISYSKKAEMSLEEATSFATSLVEKMQNPPYIQSSGNAAAGPTGDGASPITGLVSAAQGAVLPALGIIFVAGLVFVSVSVVRNSLPASTDNPIMRSAGNAGARREKVVSGPIRAKKLWKS